MLLRLATLCKSFFSTAVEILLSQKFTVLRCEHRLRAGNRALKWESSIQHSTNSRVCKVSAVFSSRTLRCGAPNLDKTTFLNFRFFSCQSPWHCDNCFKSDWERRQRAMFKVSNGLFRHLGKKRKLLYAFRGHKKLWHWDTADDIYKVSLALCWRSALAIHPSGSFSYNWILRHIHNLEWSQTTYLQLAICFLSNRTRICQRRPGAHTQRTTTKIFWQYLGMYHT